MKHNREVVLGAIVFAAIAIVVIGTAWLSENFWGAAGGYKIFTTYESVMGLNKGAHVTIRGIKVGKVLEIDMERGRPLVMLGFSTIRNLPRDSKFVLRSMGMLGDRMIEVRLGHSEEVYKDGDLAIGHSELGFEDLAADAAGMTNQVKAVIDSLTAPENINRMTRVLRSVDTSAAVIREVVVNNQEKLVATIENLSAASSDIGQLTSQSRSKLQASVDNLERTTAGLSKSAENLEQATASLDKMMTNMNEISFKINNGQGTIGRLVNDPEVYTGLASTLTAVDSLLEAVKSEPGRYLNFKFTIF
jgi:phospholipid/cholesterol/gamma-HCH transport system substrate-binding protein